MGEMKNSGIEWIGEIPTRWKFKKIKHSFNIIAGATPKSEVTEFWDGDIAWITPADYKTADVYVAGGKRNLSQAGYDSCGTTLIPSGSIVFSKRAPIGSVAINTNDLCTNQGCLSCVPKCECVTKYFYYMMSVFTEIFNLFGTGTTFKEISADNFANFSLPFPDIKEQYQIVSYLDRKCAEIDAVIEKTKATIEEYKKLKQSVITEAVTKGIRGERPMKDSGIEWIGNIPAEWDVVRIKTLFDYRNERNDKPLEEVNLISLYTDLGVVQHCDLEATTGNKASNADGYKLVYENDIVVNIILCWMGAIGRSAYTGVTSPAYDVYSPKEGTNTKFYHHLFRTQGFNGDCYKVGRGIMAMRWRTYSDQFRAIKVVAPPQEEQQDIVDYLDKKCAEIDTLIAKKTALLDEMEAYKKSVIYEYVTGKKEV